MIRRILFFALVLSTSTPSTVNAQAFFQRFCDIFIGYLPVQDASCKCGGGYAATTGLNFKINCTTANVICLDSTGLFCATPAYQGDYYRKSTKSTTTIKFDVGTFEGISATTALPLTLTLTHKAPLALTQPINFDSCKATIGTTACTSCEICNSGKGFKFNCSNIAVATVVNVPIYLPEVKNCIGLNATST